MHSNKQRYFITHFYVSMYHFICHSVKVTKHGFPQRVNFSSRGVYATTRQKLYLNFFSFLRNCPSCGLQPTYTQSLVFCLAKGCEKKTPLMSQYISQLVMLFSLSKTATRTKLPLSKKRLDTFPEKGGIHSAFCRIAHYSASSLQDRIRKALVDKQLTKNMMWKSLQKDFDEKCV